MNAFVEVSEQRVVYINCMFMITGVADAAERFAKFSLSTLLEPAIFFADKGFTMNYGLAGMISSQWNEKVLTRTDEGKSTDIL